VSSNKELQQENLFKKAVHFPYDKHDAITHFDYHRFLVLL